MVLQWWNLSYLECELMWGGWGLGEVCGFGAGTCHPGAPLVIPGNILPVFSAYTCAPCHIEPWLF